MVDLRNTKGRVEETCCEKSKVVGGSPHGSSEKLLGKLRELNLLELASVPGITNPSLLEVSLSPSACQFSLLEDLNHDIVLNCQDHN